MSVHPLDPKPQVSRGILTVSEGGDHWDQQCPDLLRFKACVFKRVEHLSAGVIHARIVQEMM